MPADGADRLITLRRDIARMATARAGASQRPTDHSGPARQPALAPLFAAGHAFGALHEILAATPPDLFAAMGFAVDFAVACAQARPRAGLVLIVEDFVVWEAGMPYGLGLVEAGVDPARLLILRTHDPKETLVAMETALRSRAVAGVLAESAVSARLYDLAASRRLLLAARNGGGAALLLPTAFSGHAPKLSSAATARFEIARAPSRSLPFGRTRLPMPGRPAFAFRLLKAPGGLTEAAAWTREHWREGVSGVPLGEAAYHAFSFHPSAVPADRPHSPARGEVCPAGDTCREDLRLSA